jgi:hypothetical protein
MSVIIFYEKVQINDGEIKNWKWPGATEQKTGIKEGQFKLAEVGQFWLAVKRTELVSSDWFLALIRLSMKTILSILSLCAIAAHATAACASNFIAICSDGTIYKYSGNTVHGYLN